MRGTSGARPADEARQEGGYLLSPRQPGRAVVLRSPLLRRAGVAHGFATRLGGVSEGDFAELNFGIYGADRRENVAENEARLGAEVGFSPELLFRQRQVHGAGVTRVGQGSEPGAVRQGEADALVTARPGAAVAAVTADCVPVLLADPGKGVVAAVHAGWRGIVAGVIGAAVEVMTREHGCRAEELFAAVGPAIGACCYEVGEEVAEPFAAMDGVVRRELGQRPHLDLYRAAMLRLTEAGVVRERAEHPRLCTRCQDDLFFSYRRDGARSGHQLSVAVCPG